MTDSEMLQKLLVAVDELGKGQAELKAEIAEVKAELADVKVELKAEIAEVKTELKAEIAEVKESVRHTRAYAESMPRQIHLIAEQHGVIIEKLNALADYPGTKERVSTLEGSVKMVADRVKTLETAKVS